jgi:hypothetical protein
MVMPGIVAGCDVSRHEAITSEPETTARDAPLALPPVDGEHENKAAAAPARKTPLAMPLKGDGNPPVYPPPPAEDPECKARELPKGPLAMGLRHGGPDDIPRGKSPLCMRLR